MLLRLAAVAALVLALARPMIRSSWLGDDDRPRGDSRARQFAVDVARGRRRECRRPDEGAGDGIDRFACRRRTACRFCWRPAANGRRPRRRRRCERARAARGIVADVEPTLGTADLLACLQSAVHLESADELTGRRIVVFTDSQAEQLAAGRHERVAAAGGGERRAPRFRSTIEVVDCGLEADDDRQPGGDADRVGAAAGSARTNRSRSRPKCGTWATCRARRRGSNGWSAARSWRSRGSGRCDRTAKRESAGDAAVRRSRAFAR